jgi:hypothetical protein
MSTKFNIHDFNTLREAVLELAKAGNLNETLALDLVDKVNALRVETFKGE